MTMPCVFARKKKPVRERLNWLLVAIASGRYGPTVTTTTPAFLADYVAAVNGTITAGESGPRCAMLGQDLFPPRFPRFGGFEEMRSLRR